MNTPRHVSARLHQTEMTRQLPPRPLGVTDKGRKLHKQYPAGDTLGYLNGNVSGCGTRLLDRLATEDEKRVLLHCRAPGCVGVP